MKVMLQWHDVLFISTNAVLSVTDGDIIYLIRDSLDGGPSVFSASSEHNTYNTEQAILNGDMYWKADTNTLPNEWIQVSHAIYILIPSDAWQHDKQSQKAFSDILNAYFLIYLTMWQKKTMEMF